MKGYILFIILLLIFGCASKKETLKENNEVKEAVQQAEQPKPPQATTYKENSTLVSAVVDTLEITDDFHFTITAKIITAIPEDWNVSIIEPDQVLTIHPAYIKDETKNIDMNNPINQKIFELRNLKRKGFFIGTVTLSRDNNYYITQVQVWQNPPEE